MKSSAQSLLELIIQDLESLQDNAEKSAKKEEYDKAGSYAYAYGWVTGGISRNLIPLKQVLEEIKRRDNEEE